MNKTAYDKQILKAIKGLGGIATIQEIADAIGATKKTTSNALRIMHGGNLVHVKEWRSARTNVCQAWAIGAGVNAPRPSPSRRALLADAGAVEFLKLNGPYLPASVIAQRLGASSGAIQDVLDAIHVLPPPDGAFEDPEVELVKKIGFLPLGTDISRTPRGTTFRMPSSSPGITSVTRYCLA